MPPPLVRALTAKRRGTVTSMDDSAFHELQLNHFPPLARRNVAVTSLPFCVASRVMSARSFSLLLTLMRTVTWLVSAPDTFIDALSAFTISDPPGETVKVRSNFLSAAWAVPATSRRRAMAE
jgi:hypothetical protein